MTRKLLGAFHDPSRSPRVETASREAALSAGDAIRAPAGIILSRARACWAPQPQLTPASRHPYPERHPHLLGWFTLAATGNRSATC